MRRAVRVRLRAPPPSLRFQRFSAKFAKIAAFRAQFASFAAPETRELNPYREDFGGLSLMRIPLVPRGNAAQTLRGTSAVAGYPPPQCGANKLCGGLA